MKANKTNKKHILLRYFFVIGFMLVFAGAIIYSMFKTSVVKADAWNKKAATLLDTTFSEPKRGLLLSENGTVLAASLDYYTVRIDWQAPGIKMDTLKKYLPALADSLHAFNPKKSSIDYYKELLTEAKSKKKRAYRLFANLTAAEYNRLRSFPFLRLRSGQNGLTKEVVPRRVKPYGGLAARSIGSVRDTFDILKINKVVGKDGKLRYDTVKQFCKHGTSGLEKALDSLLYGVRGMKMPVQLPNRITQVETMPATPGYDITTTINVAMQDIVENELYAMCCETNAQWGTAVLMEVATGEIKAISNLEWSSDINDYYEKQNHAMLGYEPGSVMKPISMMMALEDGIVDPDEPIEMTNVFAYGNASPITDTHPHGALTPREIIEHSSNVGMSKIILRKYEQNPIGFRQRLEEMGFFEPFNTGIAGEIVPRVSANMLEKQNGGCVNLTRMSYGYATRIPPIYTLAMYNAIANDGKYVRPHLVKKLSRDNEPDSIIPVTYIRKQVCSPENAAVLRDMLHRVVWGSNGTARNYVRDSIVHIAGKTGTARVTDKHGNYVEGAYRLAFCGFFPYENPKYSCIVLMSRAGRSAPASSGMVLKNIALKMYARGMLSDDNGNTFIANSAKTNATPTLFASLNAHRYDAVTNALGVKSIKTVSGPDKSEPQRNQVPDVKGLSVGDAVMRLEGMGLQVRFEGAGYVFGQNLAAGTHFKRGDVITLTLRH